MITHITTHAIHIPNAILQFFLFFLCLVDAKTNNA